VPVVVLDEFDCDVPVPLLDVASVELELELVVPDEPWALVPFELLVLLEPVELFDP
jgi:hypothetical protein